MYMYIQICIYREREGEKQKGRRMEILRHMHIRTLVLGKQSCYLQELQPFPQENPGASARTREAPGGCCRSRQ